MKTTALVLALLFSLAYPFSTVSAHHLDGLWQNHRDHLTIRIETTNEGIQVKRLDQGVWYLYTLQDDHFYVDRKGNYYEVLDENNVVWRAAGSHKNVLFERVNSISDGYRNEDVFFDDGSDRDSYDQGSRNYPADRHWKHAHVVNLQGTWFTPNRRHEFQVDQHRNGIRIRRSDGRWIFFDQVRDRPLFRNRKGDTIQILNPHTLQWRNHHKGTTLILHR